ncbi:MAG: helix-turn-helix transcriptional regulator [Candidatus Glassbacteria bacterium]|nr:helix-turn-helix transcriptional regulator [Candidatus Glassbacteria bacterium]
MCPKKSTGTVVQKGGEVEQRFNRLLSVMKERYLAAGYEFDDVHLAEILEVHDGVLRKGKSTSVSPALAKSVGRTWQVDLNWLLLGNGEEPDSAGLPDGIKKLADETRISRGRWDEHRVRRLLAEKNLSQRELSGLLKTDPQRAGNLVRGTLRDASLRKKLAAILDVEPDTLFLVSRSRLQRITGRSGHARKRFTAAEVRNALAVMLDRYLEPALSGTDGTAGNNGFESTEVLLSVPPPPPQLSESERDRYLRNREALERWSKTSVAFDVPPAVVGRYCREVVGFYDGGRLDDVGGILRDFIQEEFQMSDGRPEDLTGMIELKNGVLAIGGKEIELDDPELLAKLPEYLASEAGKRRLLSWLKENINRQRSE